MKKVGLLKSLAFLLLINIPIWVFVILLTYSKYQSLLFQTIAFAFVFVSFTTIVTFILLVVNRIIQAGKLKLTLAVIMLFVALCFTVSILAYQRLVNEGSMIADKQCLKVNPLIIQRKNSYVKSMEIILAKGSEIDYMNELNKYMDISNKYVEEQKKWLQEEKAFMNRIDYKLFLPSQVQTANQLQFDSREAEMKSTVAINKMFSFPNDLEKQKELYNEVVTETKIANEANKKSDLLWKTKPKFDLRIRFIKFHPSKCSKENLNIPKVPDFFVPPKPIQSGPISYFKTTLRM